MKDREDMGGRWRGALPSEVAASAGEMHAEKPVGRVRRALPANHKQQFQAGESRRQSQAADVRQEWGPEVHTSSQHAWARMPGSPGGVQLVEVDG